MNPIGLTLPLRRGQSGYFEQSYDTIEQIKSNIINLLRTNSGERRMQPTFSGGLQEALFDPNIQETPNILKKIIENKIKTWIPGVEVINVDLNLSDVEKNTLTDTYKVYIKITFSVNQQIASVSMEFVQNAL